MPAPGSPLRQSRSDWDRSRALNAMLGARVRAAEEQVDGDRFAAAVVGLELPWSGIALELLTLLNERVSIQDRGKQWPGSPRALSGHLRRLAPALRQVGVAVPR